LHVQGQNVAIEFRWAEGQYHRVPAMAAELVCRQVTVIVANTPAKAGTATIPIVFTTAGDPMQIALVASLSRFTGAVVLGVELVAKQLESAHEIVPRATVIAALVNPNNSYAETLSRNLQAAVRGFLGGSSAYRVARCRWAFLAARS
jgi:putative ABC transport system substrate-binding protein